MGGCICLQGMFDTAQKILIRIRFLHDFHCASLDGLHGHRDIATVDDQESGHPGARSGQSCLLLRVAQVALYRHPAPGSRDDPV